MTDRVAPSLDGRAATPRSASVAILMTTYNGERFLREQLNSIAEQSHPDWKVYVSDDGSVDSTLSVLDEYRCRWGGERLEMSQGPRQGFARNFLSLIDNSRIQADYYAFCDQDDVWFRDKLRRAIGALRAVDMARPAMFCSRTRLVDEHGKVIGLSPVFRRTPSFRNALVHSLAGANTMVLNEGARRLLTRVSPTASIVSHDWLTYLLVTGCDGKVIYDVEPTLDYRQHRFNLVGTNTSVRGRFLRAGKMFSGTFRAWNQQNLETLTPLASRFSAPNREAFLLFQRARNQRCLSRVRMLMRAGIHHQTLLGNAGLLTAAMLGKV